MDGTLHLIQHFEITTQGDLGRTSGALGEKFGPLPFTTLKSSHQDLSNMGVKLYFELTKSWSLSYSNIANC